MKMTRALRNVLHVSCAIVLVAAFAAVPATADNEDPYTKANETWISLSGTVESVSPHSFMLDYGDGVVTVEMDDGDRDADAYKLLEDDKVTVVGKIDDDLYETTTIEASSVYVESIGTYFYASPRDEEDSFVRMMAPVVIAETHVQGEVTEVGMNEFVIDTGLRELTVEVDEMSYNPLDEEGYQKIEVGDRVSVRGQMDHDFFEGRVLEADWIVELSG